MNPGREGLRAMTNEQEYGARPPEGVVVDGQTSEYAALRISTNALMGECMEDAVDIVSKVTRKGRTFGSSCTDRADVVFGHSVGVVAQTLFLARAYENALTRALLLAGSLGEQAKEIAGALGSINRLKPFGC